MQALRFIAKNAISSSMLLLLTISFTFNTNSARAETINGGKSALANVDIAIVKDARIFAKFDENMPAVVNYFTPLTEDAVINFYNKNYGEPVKRERKRGRLTLNYQQTQQQIRVIISQQNNLRQVDVLVEKSMQK
ncbi:hypothetical protein FGD67_20545 [Colwellia sp. M166]|uniref:hypothetical protein n=1 Tax=Colwellia sp. M166 TaxID=2583805 RepID=UPI00211EBA74|nr:hypothetical protein [Colwellia sp. M166]UUO25334.1 hypothetical protein FGD67_20545 [Colwellia sp. M166]|tara:strand:- start:36417 stop:36821 length:405 start_codon:yes stop_codon:yes gene_type:complete